MIPGSVEDTVARLSLWCRHTTRGLAFVEFHSEPARQQVIDALRAALPEESAPWHEITLEAAPTAIEVEIHRPCRNGSLYMLPHSCTT